MRFLLRNVAKKWEPSKWTTKPILVQAFQWTQGYEKEACERTVLECHGRSCISISSSLMLCCCKPIPGPAVTLHFSTQEAPASGLWYSTE